MPRPGRLAEEVVVAGPAKSFGFKSDAGAGGVDDLYLHRRDAEFARFVEQQRAIFAESYDQRADAAPKKFLGELLVRRWIIRLAAEKQSQLGLIRGEQVTVRKHLIAKR